MNTPADRNKLAALVSYVRLRDSKAAIDEQALLEILGCASLRYQARTSKRLLNVDLRMTAEGLQSPELAEALALPLQAAGPDLSSVDTDALRVLDEVLAETPDQRRERVLVVQQMTESEEAETESWLASIQRRRSSQPTAAATVA